MKLTSLILKLPALLLLFSTISLQLSIWAQGTEFTYQGRLNNGSNAANGNYDLRFILYDSSAGGSQQGPIVTNTATSVSNGLFTVTLDFGTNMFTGPDRWLEIGVRTNGGGFSPLTPRQKLTPSPYAIFASQAGSVSNSSVTTASLADGSVTTPKIADAAVTRAKIATGQVVTSLNGQTDDISLVAGANISIGVQTNTHSILISSPGGGSFWNLTGNAGTTPGVNFLGTIDNAALELWVNRVRALRLEPTASDPNVIGGCPANTVAAGMIGATIAGGGDTLTPNSVNGSFGTVAGGRQNVAGSTGDTVGGGVGNAASGGSATVAGGQGNSAGGGAATVAGGQGNIANSLWDTVCGGASNTASNQSATVSGGFSNKSSGIGSTVAGGESNTASGQDSTVGGGYGNSAKSDKSTIAGGYQNLTTNSYSTVGGGNGNAATGMSATVPGGANNLASGQFSFAAGMNARADHDNCFVWNDSNTLLTTPTTNLFLIYAKNGVGINGPPPTGVALNVNGTCVTPVLNAGTVNAGYITNRGNLDVASAGNFGGPVTAQGVVLTSDACFKTNIASIENALDKVQRLRGVTFDWRRQEFPERHFPANRQIGFIAQEIKDVLPDTVAQDSGGHYAVNYDAVIPLLVEAIKEQQRDRDQTARDKDAEIQQLKQSLAELKEMVSQLAQTKSKSF